MERKSVAGSIRNAEKSRQRFLDAVGQIVRESGFAALGINHIAEVAGLGKKMIYSYFGGLDELIDAYLEQQNFWKAANSPAVGYDFSDGGRNFSKEMITTHYQYVHQNIEFQKILVWGLAEQRDALKRMSEEMEANGEQLFKHITDPHFGEQSKKFRSVMAILIAGSYYLNLHSSFNGAPFCGIDLQTGDGRAEIEEALSFLVEQSYEQL